MSSSSALARKLKLRRDVVKSMADAARRRNDIDDSSAIPASTNREGDGVANDTIDDVWYSRSRVFALDDEIDELLERIYPLRQGRCACRRCLLQSSADALTDANHIVTASFIKDQHQQQVAAMKDQAETVNGATFQPREQDAVKRTRRI